MEVLDITERETEGERERELIIYKKASIFGEKTYKWRKKVIKEL
jgi:hypothetical protein